MTRATQSQWAVRACALVSVAATLCGPLPAHAQAGGDRALQSVQAERTVSGWLVTLHFSVPLRYIGHSPRESSDLTIIELEPTGVGRTEGATPLGREALRPFENGQGPPILEVSTEPGQREGVRTVEIQFREETRYEVSQGKDWQLLEVRIPLLGTPEDEKRASALLGMARQALAEADNERAAQLCTKVLELQAPSAHADALELLGLARERNGQRSHARAEYEHFLARFPDDERAPLVRQRLQAITTADEPLSEQRKAATRRPAGPRFDLHGSLSSYYSRDHVYFDDGFGNDIVDSSWISDLYLNARLRAETYEFEASASGRSRIDLSDVDFGDDSRLNSLLFEGSQRGTGWWGNAGRQRGGGGITGRFDGARLGFRPNDSLDFHLLAGFPLETYSSDSLNTDRFQVGAVGQVLEIFELVDVELYTNYQNDDSLTYRAAIGGEFRHLARGRTIVASFDYDAYFNAVNIAMLLADVEVAEGFSVNTLIEYRKSPILSLGNALIGRTEDSISDLHDSFSASQMKDLAEDRTADATTFTLGSRYDAHPRLDLSGNVTASRLSGTDTAGGVQGSRSLGYEFTYYLQATSPGLLMDRDISTIGLRVFDGDRYDAYMLQLNGRYPVAPNLRLNPILRLEYRDADDDLVRFVPRLRMDYRWRDIVFDLDVAFDMNRNLDSEDAPDEYGYSLLVGLRYDF